MGKTKELSIPQGVVNTMDGEIIRHQLHLQSLQTVIELYKACSTSSSPALISKVEQALEHLITPFVPFTPPKIEA
jgi:hypothetical protein